MFGQNQKGQEAIGIMTETFGGAGGGRGFADGVDVGGEIPNPIGRIANVETTESQFPIRYLFKVVKYNSAKVELLIINATIAANNNTRPLAASSLKNHLNGFDK